MGSTASASITEQFIALIYVRDKEPGKSYDKVPQNIQDFFEANKSKIDLDAQFYPHEDEDRKPENVVQYDIRGHTVLTAYCKEWRDADFLKKILFESGKGVQAGVNPLKAVRTVFPDKKTDALETLILAFDRNTCSVTHLVRTLIESIEPKEKRGEILSAPGGRGVCYWNTIIKNRIKDVELFRVFFDDDLLGGGSINFEAADAVGPKNTILHTFASVEHLFGKDLRPMMEEFFSSGKVPPSFTEPGAAIYNGDGMTPLMVAAQNMCVEAINEFVARRICDDLSVATSKIVMKRDLLLQLRQKEREEAKRFSRSSAKIGKSEAEKIVDPHGSTEGYTALHFLLDTFEELSDHREKECLQSLLSCPGANEAKDKFVNFEKDNALTLAIRNGLKNCALLLEANGCKKRLPPKFDLDSQDIYAFGKTKGVHLTKKNQRRYDDDDSD